MASINITVGCTLSKLTISQNGVDGYFTKLKVVSDEYKMGINKRNVPFIFHVFFCVVIATGGNKRLKKGQTLQYNGNLYGDCEIIEYPDNYKKLCAEKKERKEAIHSQLMDLTVNRV